MPTTDKCNQCNGTGNCQNCKGTGKMRTGVFSDETCKRCYNSNGRCTGCKGKGAILKK